MKNVLTIAGFDPSSGAGVTRDLDTFFSLGLHGIAAPTSIVVQGPHGVRNVFPTPFDAFSAMLTLYGMSIMLMHCRPSCLNILRFR